MVFLAMVFPSSAPFSFCRPPTPKDFLPPYLASTLVLFSLFLSFLSIRFSSLDLLAPSSVPISFCPYSSPVSPRASGHLSQFSPLSIIIAHFHQKESPGEKDLQECQLVWRFCFPTNTPGNFHLNKVFDRCIIYLIMFPIRREIPFFILFLVSNLSLIKHCY